MQYSFQAEQWLPYSVEHVFAFFSDPVNLPRLMPPWQDARIDRMTLVTPSDQPSGMNAAGVGSRILLSFRPIPFSPFRFTWDAQIDRYAPNDYFCDLQRRGPFKFWHHCHHVASGTRNHQHGTLVTDHVEYEMPFGILGNIANTVAIRAQLRSTFNFRHRRTEELLRA